MSGNDSGDYRVTLEDEMVAFDNLPPELRRALADASSNWSAHALHKRFLRKGASAAYALALIERWEREERSAPCR